MNTNIWAKMAQLEFPDGPMHVLMLMLRANELFKQNGTPFEAAPFSKVEIGFSELLDTIKSQKNQREIDFFTQPMRTTGLESRFILAWARSKKS